MRPINILITGSNYWNIGDDIVREGVMALFRATIHPRPINWFFYNFAASDGVGKCNEDPNTVRLRDLPHIAPTIDFVVFPGLNFGRELHDFQMKILELGLGPKCFFLGGMNENNYAAEWAAKGSTRRLLKQAAVVIGRTDKHPATFDTDAIPYKALPCPSILSAGVVEHPRLSELRVAMSIQLPEGTPGAVTNHFTNHDAHNAALTVLKELLETRPVDLICHHKSEYVYWTSYFKSADHLRIHFSSWFQDLWNFYWNNADVVLSTRLHGVLLARALGIPGVVIQNPNAARHAHALGKFPGTDMDTKPSSLLSFVDRVDKNPEKVEGWRKMVAKHQEETWLKYTEEIEPHVKKLLV